MQDKLKNLFNMIFLILPEDKVVNRIIVQKIVLILSGLIILGFASLRILKHYSKDRLRISCVPIFSSEPWLDMVVTDEINSMLKQAQPEMCLCYPIDWIYDIIDKDSLNNRSYLISLSKRIGLDYILFEQIDTFNKDKVKINLFLYDIGNSSQNRFHTINIGSFYFDNFTVFLESVVQKIFQIIQIKFDSKLHFTLQSTQLWKDYGWGRYHEIIGDFHLAEKNYRNGIKIDSTDSRLLKRLAKALIRKRPKNTTINKFTEDKYQEVESLLTKALSFDSTDSQVYTMLGLLYIQRERWNKAEKVLHQAMIADKDNPYTYLYFTRLHPSRYKTTGFKDKKTLLKQALYINPAFEQAYIALGEDYYFKNQPGKTEKIYLKLLSIYPVSLEGLLALGKFYVFRNDILRIIEIYNKILSVYPNYADAYYNLGIAYYNDGKVQEAIEFFQKAIELNNHANAHFYLGSIYLKIGDLDFAIEYFRKRIRLRTGDDDRYADEAGRNLYQLLQKGILKDSSESRSYIRNGNYII
jgi:tetratricopeptide (TPR) repeat protein